MLIAYIVLIVVANTAIAAFFYNKTYNIIVSSILAAPIFTVFMCVIDYLILGFIDPFIIFGFFSIMIGCVLLDIIILIFYVLFKKYIVKLLKNISRVNR